MGGFLGSGDLANYPVRLNPGLNTCSVLYGHYVKLKDSYVTIGSQ